MFLKRDTVHEIFLGLNKISPDSDLGRFNHCVVRDENFGFVHGYP